MERYIVLVPITATYLIETEAQNARHAKAIILQQLALDEDAMFNMEMTEYEIQWDSVSAVHEEKEEASHGSGFGTDREAELASMLTAMMQKTKDHLARSNDTLDDAQVIIEQLYGIVTSVCENILDDNVNLKDLARTMLDNLKNRKK